MMKFEPLTTEHDLSADIVQIDYKALIAVAQYALYTATSAIIAQASEIQDNAVIPSSGINTYLTARQLQHTARSLTVAAETVHALVEGITRSEKILINIPKDS